MEALLCRSAFLMDLTRRQLLVLGGAFAVAGCTHDSQRGDSTISSGHAKPGPVDVGPLSDYPKDGIYSRFSESHNLFIIRSGDRLFAQAATCTHRRCKLAARAQGFECPCHGSTFTLEGHVTQGPARRDLPRFAVEKTESGHLLVDTSYPLSADAADPRAFLRL
jgi:Rieske Fe-S protein